MRMTNFSFRNPFWKSIFFVIILLQAVRAWHPDVARWLIEHKADVNKADLFGRTPLHVAAAVDSPEMVNLLLDNNGWETLKHFLCADWMGWKKVRCVGRYDRGCEWGSKWFDEWVKGTNYMIENGMSV